MDDKEKIKILNGKKLSESEFENEKKILSEKKIQIVETSKNTFVTRLMD